MDSPDGQHVLRPRVMEVTAWTSLPGCFDLGGPSMPVFGGLFDRLDAVLDACRRWCAREAPMPVRVEAAAWRDV